MTTQLDALDQAPLTRTHHRPVATSALRMWAYCGVLTALAFIQDPGRIVADTKWDLAADPAGFLARALHMWDPIGAFGQVQNQAYGYFWPMGPFFAAGDAVGLPPWVVQRLWWAVLLSLAFVGLVRVAEALEIGEPWARVVAGFTFALSVHTITLLGPTSIEAWPTAVAPWVLLPLVRGSRGGSARRAGALAALAVFLCGGVNAVATAAVLPLGVIWLATRGPGRRRWALLGWWSLFTALACLWWIVPLLMLGRYSPPFLDYIENAPITSRTTGLADVLAGSSDWVAYASLTDWRAGHVLGTTPFLLIDATALAALGLAGVCRRDNPHARFLFTGVLVGVVVVSFGYAGDFHGWWAESRQAALDGVLAPLRNLHKFDVVLRLPLALGLAHFLSAFRSRSTTPTDTMMKVAAIGAAGFAIVGIASPVVLGQVAPRGSIVQAPAYWREAAAFLADHDGVRALELPASSFGNYAWGTTHDDVLQPLADSPWAVRNVIPLAQPGNVRMLDTVTSVVESGRPDARLAPYLAANGVGYLLVRNDLDLFRTGAPDPVVLHQALDYSPGLTKVAEFGPPVGADALVVDEGGTRTLFNRGRQGIFASVEIYAIDGSVSPVAAFDAATVPVVYGDPGTALQLTGDDGRTPPAVLAGDAPAELDGNPRVLTDGLPKREVAFAFVRDNQSATLGRTDAYTTLSVEPNYRIYDDQEQYETVAEWRGVEDVVASSSQADAAAIGTIKPAALPGAALDGNPDTQWQSTGFDGAVNQWWRVELPDAQHIGSVSITMGAAIGPAVTQLELATSAGKQLVEAPPPGETRTFELPAGSTDFVQIRATEVRTGGRGVQMTLAEVHLPDVDAQRLLIVPRIGLTTPPDLVSLAVDPSRPACAFVDDATSCDDVWVRQGEDGDGLDRGIPSPLEADYLPVLRASLIPGPAASHTVATALPVRARVSSALSKDLNATAVAAVDGDMHTTWTANVAQRHPRLVLAWDKARRLDDIRLRISARAAASRPLVVRLQSSGVHRRVTLDRTGLGEFAAFEASRIRIRILAWERAFSAEAGTRVALPVGVSEASLPSSDVPFDTSASPYVDLGCGSGPTITVNGVATSTKLAATVADLTSNQPVVAQRCATSPVTLQRGLNVVSASPSTVARPEQLVLTRVGSDLNPVAVPATISSWGAEKRQVSLGPRADDTLLVVTENANAGWVAELEGQTLTSVRIDGWKQGWLVPAGEAATVTLTYQPDLVYRAGLLAGIVGVIVVGVFAWRRGSSKGPGSAVAHAHQWVDAVVICLALGLLGGWVGLSLGAAAVIVASASPKLHPEYGLVAAGLLAAGGLAQALQRSETHVSTHVLGQVLIVASMATGAAVLLANGPTVLRRRKGRSNA